MRRVKDSKTGQFIYMLDDAGKIHAPPGTTLSAEKKEEYQHRADAQQGGHTVTMGRDTAGHMTFRYGGQTYRSTVVAPQMPKPQYEEVKVEGKLAYRTLDGSVEALPGQKLTPAQREMYEHMEKAGDEQIIRLSDDKGRLKSYKYGGVEYPAQHRPVVAKTTKPAEMTRTLVTNAAVRAAQIRYEDMKSKNVTHAAQTDEIAKAVAAVPTENLTAGQRRAVDAQKQTLKAQQDQLALARAALNNLTQENMQLKQNMITMATTGQKLAKGRVKSTNRRRNA